MRHYNIIIVAAVAAMALGACSVKEEVTTGTRAIRFTTNLGTYTTKVTDTNFEEGDAVSLFVEEPINQFNVKMNFHGDELVPEKQISWLEGQTGSTDFFALYPYRSDWKDVSDLNVFSVNADQSTHELYSASDLLGASYSAYPDCNSVPLNFTHRLSLFELEVNIDANGSGTIDKPKEVYLEGVYGKVRVEIYHGMYVWTVGQKGTVRTGKVSDRDWPSDGETVKESRTCWRAILPPQSMDFKVIIVTESGKQLVYKNAGWSVYEMESAHRYNGYIYYDANYSTDDFDGQIDVSEWTADNDVQFGEYIPDEYHTEGTWCLQKVGSEDLLVMKQFPFGQYRLDQGFTGGEQYHLVYVKDRTETVFGLGDAIGDGMYKLVKDGAAFGTNLSGEILVGVYPYQNQVLLAPNTDVWSVVGEFGAEDTWWQTDMDMTRDSFGVYSIDLDGYWGQQFKFRCNHVWGYDFGGYDEDIITGTQGYSYWLAPYAYNMTMADGGNYHIVLDVYKQIITATLVEACTPEGYDAFVGDWLYEKDDDNSYEITIEPDGFDYIVWFDGEPVKASFHPGDATFHVNYQRVDEWTHNTYGLIYEWFYVRYYDADGNYVGRLGGENYTDVTIYYGSISADGGSIDISPGTYWEYTAGSYSMYGIIQEGDYAGAYFTYWEDMPLPQVWTKR